MKESTGQEPIKSIEEIIYDLKRYIVMKHLTRNLGEVIEEEDRIVCYVNKNKFKKEKVNDYSISCHGIYIKDRELARKYKLDKKIVYIIEDIDFKHNRIFIFGNQDCEVIIRNCDFSSSSRINIAGKCTLENISSKSNNYPVAIYAKELIINDTTITNVSNSKRELFIIINADKKLEINNSFIGDENCDIHIGVDNEINIYCSKIKGMCIKCIAKHLVSNQKSWLIASGKLNFNVPSFYEITVSTPTLNCNDTTFSNLINPMILKQIDRTKQNRLALIFYLNKLKNTVNHNKDSINTLKQFKELTNKRLELLALLNNIKDNVNDKNDETLKKYQASLENKPISKVLSK